MGLATDLVCIVLAALVGGGLAHFLRQPLVCGYILAGIIVGPYTGGYTVQHSHEIQKLAEIGVALLLFTLGLEFSFGELRRLTRITLFATPLQIILSSLTGYGCAVLVGIDPKDALWIGGAVSLSSTMIVIKILAASGSLDSREAKIMLGILIAQDLAVVPLMLLLPQLSRTTIDLSGIFWALFKSVSFLFFMYVAGTRILPRLFTLIANQGSRELFFLSTLGFAFGAGVISHQLELSFALGAFVAGMLLSETDFNHQALSDVSQLRDLFAIIFFVSVGMLFDPIFFISHLGLILGAVIILLVAKALIIACLIMSFGYSPLTAMGVGIGLAQVGEFAFVVINFGRASNDLSPSSYSLMIAVTVVSMTLTPGLFSLAAYIRRVYEDFRTTEPIEVGGKESRERQVGHVVIIGAGFVGRYVGKVLSALDRPYVVIESNYRIAQRLRSRAVSVVFGDARRSEILEAANISDCSLVIITSTNDKILPEIVTQIKGLRSDVPVVVRVEDVEDIKSLASLAVEEIVQPQFEVGLEMVRQAMLALKFGESQVVSLLSQLRIDRYQTRDRYTAL